MELPQSRPCGAEEAGRKPTHDFLSLYSNSTAEQDPRSSVQASYLKTHDFLRPLEQVETKSSAKEEATDEISSAVQKQPPLPTPASVEHLLPGGIGTYTISHINSYVNNTQRVPKPEASLFTVHQATSADRNDDSNCSSHTSSGFTLWEESEIKKGKTEKENNVGEKPIIGVADSAAKLGPWRMTERVSQSFSNNRHGSFNSHSSSQTTGQKNQSFMEMMKSAQDCAQDDELENEGTFFLKRETLDTQRGELRVKVDGKSNDQKPNTPRSKHSATEQRRRSKINDRFQMLRQLIPHSDQKRDKASFLLEVIEYIHFLQEKVHKYEGSFQGWNNEPEKLMPWRNSDRPAESFQPRGTNSGSNPSPTLLFASKIEEKIPISPTIPASTPNVESGLSTAAAFKTIDHQSGIMNKTFQIPTSSQPNIFPSTQISGSGGAVSQLRHRLASDAENIIYQPSVETQTMTSTNEKLKEKELTIEGGAISISSVYSQGLLDTLTHALQSSGVDLSQASISVQIELGKQAKITPNGQLSMCVSKDDEDPSKNQRKIRSRVAGSEKSDQAVKKLKTCRS